jgi:hypothetical protein
LFRHCSVLFVRLLLRFMPLASYYWLRWILGEGRIRLRQLAEQEA